MVILIGGVSHAGKTFLAQQLLEKYKYPYLSIDQIVGGLEYAGYEFTPANGPEGAWALKRLAKKTTRNILKLMTTKKI